MPISPRVFAREVNRRLIDTHGLMVELGLRRRSSVWERVRAGTLPEPLFSRPDMVSFWDRDAIDLPDRKES